MPAFTGKRYPPWKTISPHSEVKKPDRPSGIGIMGGTFNPVHTGHLRVAEEVRETLRLEKVIFVPAGNPPLKAGSGLAPARKRLDMVRLAVAGNPFFEVSDLECSKSGPSYTVGTLERLSDAYPGKRLFFITGIDVFLDLHLWWRPESLIELADFVVVSRPGYLFAGILASPFVLKGKDLAKKKKELAAFDEAGKAGKPVSLKLASGRGLHLLRVTGLEISARHIRALLKEGRSARYLLPEHVLSFIIQNKIKF